MDLGQLQQELQAKQEAAQQAAKEWSDADAAFRAARTATFDQNTVAHARSLGVNPDNYGSTDHLQEAIEIQKSNGVTPIDPEPVEPTEPAVVESGPIPVEQPQETSDTTQETTPNQIVVN